MSKRNHKNKTTPKDVWVSKQIVPSVITPQDVSDLVAYCKAPIAAFEKLGIKQGRNVFIPSNLSGSSATKPRVLAVAHLDCYLGELKVKEDSIVSPALDDRLGAWAICRKLPSLVNGGRQYDILLTQDEERGMSSAEEFATQANQYNWIFELDRRGCDAAYYSFSDDVWLEALGDDGWDLTPGSFTDICAFEDGVVSAINFGIGYEHEHTTSCQVNFRRLGLQLTRIASFYNTYKDIKFPHSGVDYFTKGKYGIWGRNDKYGQYDTDKWNEGTDWNKFQQPSRQRDTLPNWSTVKPNTNKNIGGKS